MRRRGFWRLIGAELKKLFCDRRRLMIPAAFLAAVFLIVGVLSFTTTDAAVTDYYAYERSPVLTDQKLEELTEENRRLLEQYTALLSKADGAAAATLEKHVEIVRYNLKTLERAARYTGDRKRLSVVLYTVPGENAKTTWLGFLTSGYVPHVYGKNSVTFHILLSKGGILLISAVVALFAAVAAALLVGGEFGGTVKMTAVKPLTRSRYLTVKLIAQLLLSAAMCVAGLLAALLAQGLRSGFDLSAVLMTMNTGTVILAPIALLLILLFNLIVYAAFFSALSFFSAVVFKSVLAPVLATAVVLPASWLLSAFGAGNAVLYRALCFYHLDLTGYLTAAAVHAGGNYLYSLLIVLLYGAALVGAAYWVFAKREVL